MPNKKQKNKTKNDKRATGFSKILILVIVAVVLAGGVLAWQYWPQETTEQGQQAEQPIDNEQSENNDLSKNTIAILLEELKQSTELNFLVEDIEFAWSFIGKTGAREKVTIQGKGFELLNIESSNYAKINSFFQNNNFEIDGHNSGDGTLIGAMGYQRHNVVCIVTSRAVLDNSGMPVSQSEIKVWCGEKE